MMPFSVKPTQSDTHLYNDVSNSDLTNGDLMATIFQRIRLREADYENYTFIEGKKHTEYPEIPGKNC